MSTNTGVAPARATELAVAANVNDGTMTSSPAPIPSASSARCSAEVAGVDRHTLPTAHDRGELRLERRHLRALGQAAGGQHRVDRGPLLIADDRLGCWDHAHVTAP